MSTHLLIAAAYVEGLTAPAKLVLMAFADSGDEHTRESAPGLPKLRAWSGLTKSPTMTHVKGLVDAGLLVQITPGRRGRRAVYQVFPAGVPAIPHPREVAARYADDTEPVDNPSPNGSRQQDPNVELGSCETPHRVLPTGPLHASTSVSTRERPTPPASGRVENSSGFPGARPPADDAQGIRRRAHGANDVPCTRHPEHVVPCGQCANAALNADPAAVAAARQLARDALFANRTATPKGTPQ